MRASVRSSFGKGGPRNLPLPCLVRFTARDGGEDHRDYRPPIGRDSREYLPLRRDMRRHAGESWISNS